MTAYPGVDSARSRQPDQGHHQVVRHPAFAKIHRVDQIVFQLMGQRGEEGVEQQARPPRQVAANVQRRRTKHPGQGEGQDARTEGVLVPQDRVTSAQLIAVGHHHFANVCGSLLIIQGRNTCRGTGHAYILSLNMWPLCREARASA
ncbi:hypothetical protein FQZ97_750370 [compost metagenome]